MSKLPTCDYTPEKYDGPTKEEVVALRGEFLTPALVTYYKDPIMLVDGHMQYLFDETGKRYLDGFAGIVSVSVGHCHPRMLYTGRILGFNIRRLFTYIQTSQSLRRNLLARCLMAWTACILRTVARKRTTLRF